MIPNPMQEKANSLLNIEGLTVDFDLGQGSAHRALDGVALAISKNEVVALVGESGAGKTVLSHACLGLLPSNARVSGQISWRGVGRDAARGAAFAPLRGREIAMVFQDAQASLNPLYPIREQIGWILRRHRGLSGQEQLAEAIHLFESVKLSDPERVLRAYPDELSGGMNQRVGIAMALAAQPELLIADEPTSALDISIGKGIVELLGNLRRTLGLSILLITHDLGVAARLADRILVMESGKIVENAPVTEFLSRPEAESSRKLIDCYRFMNPFSKSERATELSAHPTAPIEFSTTHTRPVLA
jgi:ABC-type dipeptide/oligopeptide/nickel transport system ATPase component